MYEGLATKEMLQKRWRKDAEYEVCRPVGMNRFFLDPPLIPS